MGTKPRLPSPEYEESQPSSRVSLLESETPEEIQPLHFEQMSTYPLRPVTSLSVWELDDPSDPSIVTTTVAFVSLATSSDLAESLHPQYDHCQLPMFPSKLI